MVCKYHNIVSKKTCDRTDVYDGYCHIHYKVRIEGYCDYASMTNHPCTNKAQYNKSFCTDHSNLNLSLTALKRIYELYDENCYLKEEMNTLLSYNKYLSAENERLKYGISETDVYAVYDIGKKRKIN